METAAPIRYVSITSPMEAANSRRGNLFSPAHPSLCTVHSGTSTNMLHSHSSCRNSSSSPAPTLSQEKHQLQSRKQRYTERNDVQEAEELLNRMYQMRPLPPILEFREALGAITKAGHYMRTLSHFERLQLLGIPLDFSSLHIVMKCYCHLNRVDFGFSLLGRIIKRGYTPNVVTFTNLIKGLVLEDKATEAVDLCERLITKREIEVGEVLYGTTIKGLCKRGNTQMAIRLLRIMEEEGLKPDSVTYSIIIDSFCKYGKLDYAANLLLEMNRKGVRPDVVTYTSLMHGLCRHGKLNEASGVLKEMMDIGISPNMKTYSVFVDALSKKGMVKKAEMLIEDMKERGLNPDVVAYTNLINGYCLLGRMDDATRVLNTMVDTGLHPDVYCYNIFIRGYCKNMKLDEAMHVYREMPRRGLKPDIFTFTTLSQSLVQVGKYKAAQEVLNDMQVTGLLPDTKMCGILFDVLSPRSTKV